MKKLVLPLALLLVGGCEDEPDAVVVEPIEEEGVEQRVISGDGIESLEDVDTVAGADGE